MGTPSTTSLIDEDRYWRVDQSVDHVWSYIRSHPPDGLVDAGSSSGSGPSGMTSRGVGWSEPDRSYATGLEVEVAIAPSRAGRGTIIRADGMGEWLDARPIRDTLSGPRMHVEVADSCPPSDQGKVGVTNVGRDLRQQLLPDADPTAALFCEYGGSNIAPPSSVGRSARLTAIDASRLAHRYLHLPIAHINGGVTHCPLDDGSVNLIAFSYPGRPDVDLWAQANGCPAVTNGAILVRGAVDPSPWLTPLKPAG